MYSKVTLAITDGTDTIAETFALDVIRDDPFIGDESNTKIKHFLEKLKVFRHEPGNIRLIGFEITRLDVYLNIRCFVSTEAFQNISNMLFRQAPQATGQSPQIVNVLNQDEKESLQRLLHAPAKAISKLNANIPISKVESYPFIHSNLKKGLQSSQAPITHNNNNSSVQPEEKHGKKKEWIFEESAKYTSTDGKVVKIKPLTKKQKLSLEEKRQEREASFSPDSFGPFLN